MRKLKTHRYGNFVRAYNNVIILHSYEKARQRYDRVLNSPLSSLCRGTFSNNSQTDEFSKNNELRQIIATYLSFGSVERRLRYMRFTISQRLYMYNIRTCIRVRNKFDLSQGILSIFGFDLFLADRLHTKSARTYKMFV